MKFSELWPLLGVPGEFDMMDACDRERWRGVIEAAFDAGGGIGMEWTRGEKLALRTELDRLQMALAKTRVQLRLAARGLKHCAGWNINDDKRSALMAVVLECEAMLDSGPNVELTGVRRHGLPGAEGTISSTEAPGNTCRSASGSALG